MKKLCWQTLPQLSAFDLSSDRRNTVYWLLTPPLTTNYFQLWYKREINGVKVIKLGFFLQISSLSLSLYPRNIGKRYFDTLKSVQLACSKQKYCMTLRIIFRLDSTAVLHKGWNMNHEDSSWDGKNINHSVNFTK